MLKALVPETINTTGRRNVSLALPCGPYHGFQSQMVYVKEADIMRCHTRRWLSVSGQSVPVSDSACGYDSHWLSFGSARDMTMSTKTWRIARRGKVECFAKMDDVCCAFQKMRTDQLLSCDAACQQISSTKPYCL